MRYEFVLSRLGAAWSSVMNSDAWFDYVLPADFTKGYDPGDKFPKVLTSAARVTAAIRLDLWDFGKELFRERHVLRERDAPFLHVSRLVRDEPK